MYQVECTLFDENVSSQIMLVMDTCDNRKYIWKAIRDNGDTSQVDSDAFYLGNIVHENVIKAYGMVNIQGRSGILLARAEGGDLLDIISNYGRPTEFVMRNVAACMIKALDHIHNCGVIHRDVKPDNILSMCLESEFSGRYCVLSDFGCAAMIGQCRGVCGSSVYRAPEMYDAEFYGSSVDMWALGITLFACVAGVYPFPYLPRNEEEAEMPEIWDVSYECQDFISRLLQFDVAERMTTQEAMSHAWLVNLM